MACEKTGGKVVDFASAAGVGATLDKAGCEANLKKACDGAGDRIVLKNYMGVHCDDKDLFDAISAVGTLKNVIFAFAGDELKRLCDMDVTDEVATKRSHFKWAEENGLLRSRLPLQVRTPTRPRLQRGPPTAWAVHTPPVQAVAALPTTAGVTEALSEAASMRMMQLMPPCRQAKKLTLASASETIHAPDYGKCLASLGHMCV